MASDPYLWRVGRALIDIVRVTLNLAFRAIGGILKWALVPKSVADPPPKKHKYPRFRITPKIGREDVFWIKRGGIVRTTPEELQSKLDEWTSSSLRTRMGWKRNMPLAQHSSLGRGMFVHNALTGLGSLATVALASSSPVGAVAAALVVAASTTSGVALGEVTISRNAYLRAVLNAKIHGQKNVLVDDKGITHRRDQYDLPDATRFQQERAYVRFRRMTQHTMIGANRPTGHLAISLAGGGITAQCFMSGMSGAGIISGLMTAGNARLAVTTGNSIQAETDELINSITGPDDGPGGGGGGGDNPPEPPGPGGGGKVIDIAKASTSGTGNGRKSSVERTRVMARP